jgi:hypothetical protein
MEMDEPGRVKSPARHRKNISHAETKRDDAQAQEPDTQVEESRSISCPRIRYFLSPPELRLPAQFAEARSCPPWHPL